MEGDASDSSKFTSLLLVPERDLDKELWHGPRAGTDGALSFTGDSNLHHLVFDSFIKPRK